MCSKIKILVVGGATATGKSALGVSLAKKLSGEIVSSDSMQVYRMMDRGTAKPTPDERGNIPHYMLDVCSPDTSFSSADWVAEAAPIIEEISGRGKLPIVCGGTGMYIDALLRPTHFSAATENEEIRSELRDFADVHGLVALHERLRQIDPESARAIHPNNVKRVIRALEIYLSTGVTKTELDRRSVSGESRYDARIITVDYESRDVLYSRINSRVDEMISSGLKDEVSSLMAAGLLKDGSTAAQAIGYKEMMLHIRGEISLEDAAELIKKNTRNYAKRQFTWFSRYSDISVCPDCGGVTHDSDELAENVIARLRRDGWI